MVKLESCGGAFAVDLTGTVSILMLAWAPSLASNCNGIHWYYCKKASVLVLSIVKCSLKLEAQYRQMGIAFLKLVVSTGTGDSGPQAVSLHRAFRVAASCRTRLLCLSLFDLPEKRKLSRTPRGGQWSQWSMILPSAAFRGKSMLPTPFA
jgi:hypothetical protein